MVRFTGNPGATQRLRDIARGVEPRLDDPALLRALGATHRKQEEGIFRSEGKTGAGGPWAALNPRYAARKAKVVGRKKILQLSGDTKRRFTIAGDPGYVEQYVPRGTLGTFLFGARSNVAAAHLFGDPSLAPSKSTLAKRVFGGRAPRLAVRDMLTKTPEHMEEMRRTLLAWYIKRVRQFLRGRARLLGSS